MIKKISICLAWHNLNSSNYGVGALAIAHLSMLLEAARLANAEIEIETLGTSNVTDLSIKREIEELFGIEVPHVNFSLGKLLREALRFDFSLFRAFSKYDLILDIGEGDSFTDIYGEKRFYSQLSTKVLGYLNGNKLILAPQTIGPFNGLIARTLAALIMKRAHAVYVRDRISGKFARTLGIHPIEVTDVAFSLPFQSMTKRTGSVGINVSGLMWSGGYSGNNDFNLRLNYKDFILKTIAALRARDKEVHLVSHVITDKILVEDDFRASQAVKSHFDNDINVIVGPRFQSPIEAKSYISQFEFFSGARMHATIGSISAGVPTIPIAYSRKFSGLFGSLGYPYTLNAYELDTNTLITRLLDFHDNHKTQMEQAVRTAVEKANSFNREYVAYLARMLSDEKRC